MEVENISRVLPERNVVNKKTIFIEERRYRLTDFRTIATLGRGAYGTVELVICDHDRSKSFALKKMAKSYIVQKKKQRRICSERQLLLQIHSPFINRLYATFKDNKYVYLVLEACLGGDLWSYLHRRGHLEDHEAQFTTACVVEALAYLQEQHIVHRDVKPENLLIDSMGYIKLCDFGMAKYVPQGTLTYSFCGTPSYTAPEVIYGRGHNHMVDKWSLGVLLYEILTGCYLFTGSDKKQLFASIRRGVDKIDFPESHIKPTANQLIRLLCHKSPFKRLGVNGTHEIKQSEYFAGFDWVGLETRTLRSPISLMIFSPTDTSNFPKCSVDMTDYPDETSGWDIDF